MTDKWRVEGSGDGVIWTELVSFYGAELAQATFDAELGMNNYDWIRLVSPDGRIEEKAYTKSKKR